MVARRAQWTPPLTFSSLESLANTPPCTGSSWDRCTVLPMSGCKSIESARVALRSVLVPPWAVTPRECWKSHKSRDMRPGRNPQNEKNGSTKTSENKGGRLYESTLRPDPDPARAPGATW